MVLNGSGVIVLAGAGVDWFWFYVLAGGDVIVLAGAGFMF